MSQLHYLTHAQTIIAILTMWDNQHQFRGNRANFIDIILTGQNMNTLVYVTTPKLLNLSSPYIKGYTYHPQLKKWIMRNFPRPDVIYNRIPNRSDEQLPLVRNKLEQYLNEPDVKIFNPCFFNKWELFKWLSYSSKVGPFLPATKRYINYISFRQFLLAHPTVYLKPATGKAGQGIIRIVRMRNLKLNKVSYLIKETGKVNRTFYSIKKVWLALQHVLSQATYLMQQGIPLITYQERPFDLRLLLQKNGTGKWQVTGLGARLAGLNSITTHVPRGGSVENPIQLLQQKFGQQKTQLIYKKTKEAALMIAEEIEFQSKQNWGEMSMDIGVDTKGQMWFFEANAKPMKFDEPLIRKHSLQNIIAYSQFLASRLI